MAARTAVGIKQIIQPIDSVAVMSEGLLNLEPGKKWRLDFVETNSFTLAILPTNKAQPHTPSSLINDASKQAVERGGSIDKAGGWCWPSSVGSREQST
ncbi:hypothetical protein [Pseudomonas chlororaphis]|uniref:hypothetical protein n=1 Tax=Pseudomonas chlororaphis TaxID=587753 RepID=UPI001FF0980C|nr:hypothetical protein [Pseudomonas chlororaphis]